MSPYHTHKLHTLCWHTPESKKNKIKNKQTPKIKQTKCKNQNKPLPASTQQPPRRLRKSNKNKSGDFSKTQNTLSRSAPFAACKCGFFNWNQRRQRRRQNLKTPFVYITHWYITHTLGVHHHRRTQKLPIRTVVLTSGATEKRIGCRLYPQTPLESLDLL